MATEDDLTKRALPDDPRPRPWAIYRYGKETLYLPVLEAARNYADKAYPVGPVEIEHIDTGEQWKRRAGKWDRTRDSRQTEMSLGALKNDHSQEYRGARGPRAPGSAGCALRRVS